MPAPTSLPPPPQGNAAALAALKNPPRDMPTREPDSSGPVDFASLMKARNAESGEFAALQAVKAELAADAEASPGELIPGDLGALLAEIAQPLPPTTIPLVPLAAPLVAPGSGPLSGAADGRDSPAPGTGAVISADLFAALTDPEAANEPGQGSGGQDPGSPGRFRLPDPSPLALSHGPAQGAGAPPHAPLAQPAQLAAQQPFRSPQWSGELGQGLVWMARNEVQTAQVAINPPNLGPIEITLTLNKDRATAHFASPFADVREAIQEALPRLREVLEGAGVQLGQADVGDQSRQELARQGTRPRGNGPEFSLEHATLRPDAAVNESSAGRARPGRGLVDTFV